MPPDERRGRPESQRERGEASFFRLQSREKGEEQKNSLSLGTSSLAHDKNCLETPPAPNAPLFTVLLIWL